MILRTSLGYLGSVFVGFAVAYLLKSPLTMGQIGVFLLTGGVLAGYCYRPWSGR